MPDWSDYITSYNDGNDINLETCTNVIPIASLDNVDVTLFRCSSTHQINIWLFKDGKTAQHNILIISSLLAVVVFVKWHVEIWWCPEQER